MWIPLVVVTLFVFTQVASQDISPVYARESLRDDTGQQCLTSCKHETKQCIINWQGRIRNCRTQNQPAPIYKTTQGRGSEVYCVSNCGPYDDNFSYEWCYTKTDYSKWDYCSKYTRRSVSVIGQPQGKARGIHVWCHFIDQNKKKEMHPKSAALPRIPVLSDKFVIGVMSTEDNFVEINSDFDQLLSYTSFEIGDHYVTEIAEAIENVEINEFIQVVQVNELYNPVNKYSMVKVNGQMVPGVIRAHITKSNVNYILNNTTISRSMETKLAKQMANTSLAYVSGTLIGFGLGGPNTEYNIVPRNFNWNTDDWADMEESIINWCRRTNGSVDVVMVVFYSDALTPIPKAIGVALTFVNADYSIFGTCREKIYWNILGNIDFTLKLL